MIELRIVAEVIPPRLGVAAAKKACHSEHTRRAAVDNFADNFVCCRALSVVEERRALSVVEDPALCFSVVEERRFSAALRFKTHAGLKAPADQKAL